MPKFDRTNMSRILVSRLYAISGGRLKDLGHLSVCLQETPVRQDDFARGGIKETHDRSLFGGRFAVGLQCFCRGMGLTWSRAFLIVFWGYLKKEVDHFLSCFLEVCIV